MPLDTPFDDDRPGGAAHPASAERGPSGSSGTSGGASRASGGASGASSARPWLWALAVVSFMGALFAALSTADFVEHLDRQVHSIHCSFVPTSQELGDSGCRTVMMSPYSSLLRDKMWGGLPISLLALAVFAFMVYRSVDSALSRRVTRKDTLFLLLATVLPVLMSVIYGSISINKIGAICRICLGIYLMSGLSLAAAVMAHVKADHYETNGGLPVGPWARWFAEGVGFVVILVAVYVAFRPDSTRSALGCGTLARSDDPNGVMVPLGGGTGGQQSTAVLDPLCPACKAFDERLVASGLDSQLQLRGVMFPLDASCNWMIKQSLHPGACAVSEAILCDKQNARQILSWAFENQSQLVQSAKESDSAVRDTLRKQFPSVRDCLGSPLVRNKLNKSLRWAIANALPVLTPQLFVGDRRVCDEDTDLGLEYTLSTMLADSSIATVGRR